MLIIKNKARVKIWPPPAPIFFFGALILKKIQIIADF